MCQKKKKSEKKEKGQKIKKCERKLTEQVGTHTGMSVVEHESDKQREYFSKNEK